MSWQTQGNSAECVLLAPDEYVRIIDELNDARLFALAANRLSHVDSITLIPAEMVWERLGITDDDLNAAPEVEFE